LPAGLFSICTGSYHFTTAFVEVDGVYTNKAPGGIAYRCSFRVTEAAYLIERMMDILADELKDGYFIPQSVNHGLRNQPGDAFNINNSGSG